MVWSLKGIQEYLQNKISQNRVETINNFLIFLKLQACYTLNVLETNNRADIELTQNCIYGTVFNYTNIFVVLSKQI